MEPKELLLTPNSFKVTLWLSLVTSSTFLYFPLLLVLDQFLKFIDGLQTSLLVSYSLLSLPFLGTRDNPWQRELESLAVTTRSKCWGVRGIAVIIFEEISRGRHLGTLWSEHFPCCCCRCFSHCDYHPSPPPPTIVLPIKYLLTKFFFLIIEEADSKIFLLQNC